MDWEVGGCVDGWVGVGWVGVWLAGGVGPAALRQRGIRPAGGVSRDPPREIINQPFTHSRTPTHTLQPMVTDTRCPAWLGALREKCHAEVIVLKVTMRMNTKRIQHQYM